MNGKDKGQESIHYCQSSGWDSAHGLPAVEAFVGSPRSSNREMWGLKERENNISCPHCYSPAADGSADPPAVTGRTVSLGETSLSVGGNLHDAPLVHLSIQCPSVLRRAFYLGTQMPSALRYRKAHRWMQPACAYWNGVICDHIWSGLKHTAVDRGEEDGAWTISTLWIITLKQFLTPACVTSMDRRGLNWRDAYIDGARAQKWWLPLVNYNSRPDRVKGSARKTCKNRAFGLITKAPHTWSRCLNFWWGFKGFLRIPAGFFFFFRCCIPD